MTTWFLRVLLWVGLLPMSAWAAQNVLDTDNFGGTAGTALPAYNAKWANITNFNNCAISPSGGGLGGNDCVNRNTGQTWTNNQWVEAKVESVGTRMMLGVRNNSTDWDNGYQAGSWSFALGDTKYYIIKRTDSVSQAAVAGPSTANMQVGDVVNLEVDGTMITLRVNGKIVLGPVRDADHSTGNVFITATTTSGTTKGWSTWRAGSVTAAAGGSSSKRRSHQ
jgi:hypothetical protein